MSRRWLIVLLIFMIAVFLRLYLLTEIPPGMTHDEADHGLDAWGVVGGIRPIYFTVGYGREPLFDYATAVLMSFLGPTYLAGRLTAVFFSLILLAATYAWTHRAFNQRIALFTVAGLAVSFWGVMTSRHALRSVTMPALFTLAVYGFWRVGMGGIYGDLWGLKRRWMAVFVGIGLGLTFYTYIPSRIMWLLLPAISVVALLVNRHRWRELLLALVVTLGLAAVVGFPLFYHLSTTDAEARLDQLDGPLDAAREGNFAPLLTNAWGALKLFTVEGDAGDVIWRYNIPGRPLLTPVMGILFYLGIAIAIYYAVRPPRPAWRIASLCGLFWLIGGLSPALITGPEASTTRAIAMQPVLYLFPALTLNMLFERWQGGNRPIIWLIPLLLFGWVGANTYQAYFVEWGNNPNVRVHYESTLVEKMRYLDANNPTVAAISTNEPNRFHDPSTAFLALNNHDIQLRWFDGRNSLLLPNHADSVLLFSGDAPLQATLATMLALEPAETLPLREGDLDRPITVYHLDTVSHANQILRNQMTAIDPVLFGEQILLLGYEVLGSAETIEALTMWEIIAPIDNLVLFTHLLAAPDQPPVAQADHLDVPSTFWVAGDKFIQRHHFVIPPDLPSGEYTINVGAYTRPDPNTFLRLPVTKEGTTIGDSLLIDTLTR